MPSSSSARGLQGQDRYAAAALWTNSKKTDFNDCLTGVKENSRSHALIAEAGRLCVAGPQPQVNHHRLPLPAGARPDLGRPTTTAPYAAAIAVLRCSARAWGRVGSPKRPRPASLPRQIMSRRRYSPAGSAPIGNARWGAGRRQVWSETAVFLWGLAAVGDSGNGKSPGK